MNLPTIMLRHSYRFKPNRISVNTLDRCKQSIGTNFQCRFIYSENDLEIPKYYKFIRQQKSNESKDLGLKNLQKLNESSIVNYDFQTLICNFDGSQELLELLKKFIIMHLKAKSSTFHGFAFGPLIMKMFYERGMIDEAFEFLMSEDTGPYFCQLVSYQIVMTMLFNAKRYEDNHAIYNKIYHDGKIPLSQSNTLLLFASYYKMNTMDAFHHAVTLNNIFSATGKVCGIRSLCFGAALAVNQNLPEYAFEFIRPIQSLRHVKMENIVVRVNAKLRNFNAIHQTMSRIITDKPRDVCHFFTKDVISDVEESLQEAGLDEVELIKDCIAFAKNNNLIMDITLEELLCEPRDYH